VVERLCHPGPILPCRPSAFDGEHRADPGGGPGSGTTAWCRPNASRPASSPTSCRQWTPGPTGRPRRSGSRHRLSCSAAQTPAPGSARTSRSWP
jgi:hypothetical protein